MFDMDRLVKQSITEFGRWILRKVKILRGYRYYFNIMWLPVVVRANRCAAISSQTARKCENAKIAIDCWLMPLFGSRPPDVGGYHCDAWIYLQVASYGISERGPGPLQREVESGDRVSQKECWDCPDWYLASSSFWAIPWQKGLFN